MLHKPANARLLSNQAKAAAKLALPAVHRFNVSPPSFAVIQMLYREKREAFFNTIFGLD